MKRRVCPRPIPQITQPLTSSKAYDIHHRPLPQKTPIRANSRASTLSSTTTSAPTSAPNPTPAQTSTPPPANKLTPSRPERPHSGTVVVLEQLDEAQTRRSKERSEWARKTEERRLDKLKAYTAAEEIQSLGQKQAALVDKMIQDLFALTPEWEVRRMKIRAVSSNTLRLIPDFSRAFIPPSVQSQSCECEGTLNQPVDQLAARPTRKEDQNQANLVRVTQSILIPLYFSITSYNRSH